MNRKRLKNSLCAVALIGVGLTGCTSSSPPDHLPDGVVAIAGLEYNDNGKAGVLLISESGKNHTVFRTDDINRSMVQAADGAVYYYDLGSIVKLSKQGKKTLNIGQEVSAFSDFTVANDGSIHALFNEGFTQGRSGYSMIYSRAKRGADTMKSTDLKDKAPQVVSCDSTKGVLVRPYNVDQLDPVHTKWIAEAPDGSMKTMSTTNSKKSDYILLPGGQPQCVGDIAYLIENWSPRHDTEHTSGKLVLRSVNMVTGETTVRDLDMSSVPDIDLPMFAGSFTMEAGAIHYVTLTGLLYKIDMNSLKITKTATLPVHDGSISFPISLQNGHVALVGPHEGGLSFLLYDYTTGELRKSISLDSLPEKHLDAIYSVSWLHNN